jgi:hypothetical protein
MTVIEIPDFIMAAERLIDEAEREELVAFVATNPEGDVVPETGGVRKLRWLVWSWQAGRRTSDLLLPH